MIELIVDEKVGIIRVTGTDSWTIAEVDAHFARLEAAMDAFRAQGRPIRVLRDVTGANIQTPEIEGRIKAHSARLYRPGDRSALVVKTSLLKAHVRDATASTDVALFCSYAAAETWLFAHDLSISA